MKSVAVVSLVLLTLGACGRSRPERAAAAADSATPKPTAPQGSLHWPADEFSRQIGLVLEDSTRAQVPVCRGTPLVTSDSLGPVAPTGTLSDVLRRCPEVWPFFHLEEGDASPAVAVRLGSTVLQIELSDSLPSARIYRLMSNDSGARTAEGIGPGATFGALEAAYGRATLGVAECAVYAWTPSHPHISWILMFPEGWDCEKADSAPMPNGPRPPADTRIGTVIVAQPAPRASN